MARWQPFAVAVALAAPPVVLAILVWPTSVSADVEVEATLAPGESADGSVSGTLSTDYEVVGDGSGPVRITVTAEEEGFDATLTLVDPDGGDRGFNDDTNGVNPELTIDLDDGETVIAEVRSLNGPPGNFTIRVATGDEDEVSTSGGGGGGRDGGVRVFPPAPGGVATTIIID